MDIPPPAGESATIAITNYIVCLAREGESRVYSLFLGTQSN